MSRGAAVVRLALLGLVLFAGVVILRTTPVGSLLSREGILGVIDYLRESTWAPLLFVVLYAASVAVAFPGTILTLTGGAVFGFWGGFLLNSIGANLGASLAFLLARILGRDGVRALLRGENLQSHLDRLDDLSRKHGFRGVFILRLIPLVPFNILNFGPGLTAMRWRTYAGATLIGIIPGTAVYTLFADALLDGSQEASREAFLRVLLAGVLLVLLSLIPVILKKMKISLPGAAGVLLALSLAGGWGAHPLLAQDVPAQEVSAQDVAARAIPDHEAFDRILARVVSPPYVDYRALQEDRDELDRYVETLGDTDPAVLAAAPRGDQLAFWINAYNACMLELVIDHYPITRGDAGFFGSIRNWFAGYPANSVRQIRNVFTTEHCRVAGEERSQDEIEHEIIRPTFQEPRIHFAVNCAARSCPVLWPEAYHGDRLDAQLDRAVERFVATDSQFELDAGNPATLHLNKVMDWYRDDFGGIPGLKAFFARYLEGERHDLVLAESTDVVFFDYDWTLNDIPR